MSAFQMHHIHTTIHGRYLEQAPEGNGPFPLFIGFHGYGQPAEELLAMMQSIADAQHWACCAVQALHAFYNRNDSVGASWMTSQDRELRIQENVRYVDAVVNQLKQTYAIVNTLVYFGFSQGAGMACRAALLGESPPSGVMLLGGDIPPEFKTLNRMAQILIGRGTHDRFYVNDRFESDVERIRQSGLPIRICNFDGGHEFGEDYKKAASDFLHNVRDRVVKNDRN